jgi:hypothetical protein
VHVPVRNIGNRSGREGSRYTSNATNPAVERPRPLACRLCGDAPYTRRNADSVASRRGRSVPMTVADSSSRERSASSWAGHSADDFQSLDIELNW